MAVSYPTIPGFDTVAIEVPGDGNCFFHAVMLGCIKAYIEKPEQRHAMVTGLRREMASYLGKVLPSGKTVYETLSRGELPTYALAVPEYSYTNMVALLYSSACVGLEVVELISRLIDVNIIFWDHQKKDIYRHGDKELLFVPGRSTVFILYMPGHYCLLGLRMDEKIYTHFSGTNVFLQALNASW